MKHHQENCCLFYKQCIFCAQPCTTTDCICTECKADLPWLTRCCSRCALPVPTSAEVICAHCLRQTPSFDQVSALFTYRFPIDRCINLIKTQRQPAYLGHLAALAASHFQDRRQPDYILPIPMHWISQQRRGFNHAQLLAEQLGKRLQLPVQDSCLIKHRATQQQHSLSKIERRRNLRNVFSCRYPPARHVVLVDDVMTTGATLQEASRVLKQQGAEIVDAWVLARTP